MKINDNLTKTIYHNRVKASWKAYALLWYCTMTFIRTKDFLRLPRIFSCTGSGSKSTSEPNLRIACVRNICWSMKLLAKEINFLESILLSIFCTSGLQMIYFAIAEPVLIEHSYEHSLISSKNF